MKSQSKHDRLAERVPAVLAGLLGIDPNEITHHRDISGGADFLISAAGYNFLVEFKISTGAALVEAAARQVRQYAEQAGKNAVALLAVPFMGGTGRRLCEEAGVSWLDLSGNARIVAKGLRIIASGQPNRFREAGRPRNLFAPKSSRLIRWLLIHPEASFAQREIARATEMDEGFVSRLASRLEAEGYIIRNKDGSIQAKDSALLLDAWQEAYRFSGHTLIQGHVAARSGEELLLFVRDVFAARNMEYAVTGLAAAWAFTRFAAFRTATLYLPQDPPQQLLEELGFRKDSRGANLWLAVPNDAGVFQGAVNVILNKNGETGGVIDNREICCVHPVQVYLDLKGHPERSGEAAQRLREELLTWRRND
jgi:hypothetical protein